MNKNILIAILVVIIVGIAAFAVFSTTTAQKVDTQFNLLTDNSLSDGDQFQFQLRELNGSAIAGEKVQIGLTDSVGNVEVYDVVTDSNGKGAIVIENEDSGSHDLTLPYAGNDKFKECSLKLNITVDDGSSDSDDDSTQDVSDDNSVSSNESSNSNSTTPDNPEHVNYDPEHDAYYTDDGTIVGGNNQWYGANYYELQKRGDDWFAGIS